MRLLDRLANWVEDVAIACDEMGNAVTGGNPHWTISARAEVARKKGKLWGCWLCRFLELWEKGHCAKALAQQPGGES